MIEPSTTAQADETTEESTSQVLRRFRADLPAGRVSLADFLAALGDRSLGTVLLALSLPCVSPVPLGISVLFNLPVLLFTFRLALGGDGPALPGWLLRRSADSKTVGKLLDAAVAKVAGIERLLRPRRHRLAHIDSQPWFKWWLAVLALTAFVPVPLMGWLPGFSLVVLALGLIERDGTAVAVSLALGVAALLAGALLIGGLSYAGQELLSGN
jgi:hypothetical protein